MRGLRGRSLGILLHPSPVGVHAPDRGTMWGCWHGASDDGNPWLRGVCSPCRSCRRSCWKCCNWGIILQLRAPLIPRDPGSPVPTDTARPTTLAVTCLSPWTFLLLWSHSAGSEMRKRCGSHRHQTRPHRWPRGWDAKGRSSAPLPCPTGPHRRSREPWRGSACCHRGDIKQPAGCQGRL